MPPLSVFISSSRHDDNLRSKLLAHFAPLRWQGIVRDWHERLIGAGEDIRHAIDQHLEAADLVMLLVSSDFLASRYCYDVEVRRALERHRLGHARVIPVILRDCDWHAAGFGHLKALPTNGLAVTSWKNEDEAFADIVRELRNTLSESLAQRATSRADPAAGNRSDNRSNPYMTPTSRFNRRICRAHPMHIVLVADNSSSMNSASAAELGRGVQDWITELQALAGGGTKTYFRFSMIVFGSAAKVVHEAVNINDIDTDTLPPLINGAGGTTNLAAALELASQILAEDYSRAEDCPPFVFLYTDGRPDDPAAALEAASVLKTTPLKSGVPRVVVLGLADADEGFLQNVATSPEFYKHCQDSQRLATLLPKIGTPTGRAGISISAGDFMNDIAQVVVPR